MLELGPSSLEPLAAIPVLKVLSASESIIDGSMDYGEVLHDYLAGGTK
jgi:acetoacetate decarboxylase